MGIVLSTHLISLFAVYLRHKRSCLAINGDYFVCDTLEK